MRLAGDLSFHLRDYEAGPAFACRHVICTELAGREYALRLRARNGDGTTLTMVQFQHSPNLSLCLTT